MARPNLGLALADGSRWVIRTMDDEVEAAVQELGRVMRLSPARDGRDLCVVSCRKGAREKRGSTKHRLFCRLASARGRQAEVFRMERILGAIVEQSLARGGLLLHAALAVHHGVGFVLAGPSGVGKSTASRRMPAPWQSLSDDCVLVVRSKDGLYWAHPWPTWSLLRKRGTIASWPVERAVPLKALLFLTQSTFDRVEPIATTLATALIVESSLHLVDTVMLTPDGYANQTACRKYLRAAWALASAVRTFRLQVSLNGQFWSEIERVVAAGHATDRRGIRTDRNSETRNQNGGLRSERTVDKDTRATGAGSAQRVPEPPHRSLSGTPGLRLVRFQTRDRTFMKLLQGQLVVASANDLLREWHTQRRSRRGS
jgi:SynChlorMet cassette protein ScmC